MLCDINMRTYLFRSMTSTVFVENRAELVEAFVRVTASQGRALELSGVERLAISHER